MKLRDNPLIFCQQDTEVGSSTDMRLFTIYEVAVDGYGITQNDRDRKGGSVACYLGIPSH